MFELKIGSQVIPVKWGTWAMKRFCEIRGVTLIQYFDILQAGQFSIDDVISFLRAAAEYGCMKENKSITFGEMEVCEWIDECGGMGASSGPIHDFFKHLIESSSVNTTSDEKSEKKS